MLTLHKSDEGIQIAELYDNQSDDTPKPVYWHPKKDATLKLGIDDVEPYLSSEKFRDYYRLSRNEARVITAAIKKGRDIPEETNRKLSNKFFSVKKDLETKLYNQMDLTGSDQFLRVDFPRKKSEWSGLHICIGCSGGGKTFSTADLILANLKGPKSQRRQFVYASTELGKDSTLKKLMSDRYSRWVRGVDLSDDAHKESQLGVEEWFNRDILPVLRSVESGGHIVLDDPRDSKAAKYLLQWQNTAYRTVRHRNVGLTSIQHSMRGGRWSSQAYSSVKFVHTFPRGSGKGKLVDYLSKDVGVPLRQAREYIEMFAEGGRRMTIRMHSPAALIGPKHIVLL